MSLFSIILMKILKLSIAEEVEEVTEESKPVLCLDIMLNTVESKPVLCLDILLNTVESKPVLCLDVSC